MSLPLTFCGLELLEYFLSYQIEIIPFKMIVKIKAV